MVSSPLKLREGGGETFGRNLWGVVLHGGGRGGGGGDNDQIMPKEGSFINAFSNNLNSVNFFRNHVGIFT